MEVILIGHPKSKSTKAAQRFFSERRVAVHDRDLRKRSASPKELRRWSDRLGIESLLDETSRSYVDHGLAYLSLDTDAWLERLAEDPGLLRLPLVRYGDIVTAGHDPDGWQRIADEVRSE
ncbi:arsenate reductase [Egibacter rhizosphaerae]|uniref:Arsenate reductase n=1 Tax=Egibacter rhizosphaerae TaxID=1670831 RepID=A0A411YAH4_9ACTN|nr:ArsC/Spx/MgsR family protein [Egibacter rhizosphaerae]QBI18179.1 arsenate reductase [Egibacter rhizosphaerae]